MPATICVANPITQGQVNGFPIYRLLWQTMGSTHRMFAWCVTKRSEPSPLLPARNPMLTLNFSNAGAAAACRSKHQQFGDNRESDLLMIERFGSTAISSSLGVVPRKRKPVIFEHVIQNVRILSG